MTTQTKILPPPKSVKVHPMITLAGRLLYCIMPGCNGRNHVWCSCD